MKEWLIFATTNAIVVINAMALIVIVAGTIEAFYCVARAVLTSADVQRNREIWARFARWLVAGLTFQLAADILGTSITDDWETIGRIAAVAVIRTFLNFFLDHDLADSERRKSSA